jgi:hypothetical protein
VSWGDPLSVLGCEVAGIAFGYLTARIQNYRVTRPFRSVSPYIPPIVAVRPPTVTESAHPDLFG